MTAKKSRKKNERVRVFTLPASENAIDPTAMERFPEHARLIGCFIAEWSVAEHWLALWLGLQLSDDAAIIRPMIYAIESSRARVDAMAAAMDQLFARDQRARLKVAEVFKEALQLLTLRNRYAHGYFGDDPDSGELAITSPASAKRPINIPVHELKHHFERLKRFSHRMSLIVAAEIGLPLRGPHEPGSVPAHPLGSPFVRTRSGLEAPPPPSPMSQPDDPEPANGD
jgi:hypothetical protein